MPHSSPIPAATVMLLRETDGGHASFEVFLVKRPAKASFMADAHVFPGGRVDERDRAREWRGCCDGLDAFLRRGREDAVTELAHGVAAMRELLEEAGILLARGPDRDLTPTDDAIGRARTAVHQGQAAFLDVCQVCKWRLALDVLYPWSRWVTPAFEPRRFDTRFYAARWHPAAVATHDGHETVDSAWMTPAEALARSERGEHLFGLPTLRTLGELARFESIDAVLAASATRPLDPVDPLVVEQDKGLCLVLPGDPAYPRPVSFAVAPPTRYRLDGDRWRPA